MVYEPVSRSTSRLQLTQADYAQKDQGYPYGEEHYTEQWSPHTPPGGPAPVNGSGSVGAADLTNTSANLMSSQYPPPTQGNHPVEKQLRSESGESGRSATPQPREELGLSPSSRALLYHNSPHVSASGTPRSERTSLLSHTRASASRGQGRRYPLQDDPSYGRDVEMVESPHVRPLYVPAPPPENDWEIQQTSRTTNNTSFINQKDFPPTSGGSRSIDLRQSQVSVNQVASDDDSGLIQKHKPGSSGDFESAGRVVEYKPNQWAKPWLRKLNRNFFHPRARYRWGSPVSYQLAGHFYISHVQRRHRDAASRVWNKAEDDRYLNPQDARAKTLVVQTTNPIYDGSLNSSWRRTYVRNVSSLIVRVARWPFQNVPESHKDWVRQDWITVGLWWLPTCCALLLVLYLPEDTGGQIRNGGGYDTFPYRFWGYSRVARNLLEDPRRTTLPAARVPDRILRPRYLCFLKHPNDRQNLHGADTLLVDEWLELHDHEELAQYLFMSYTGLQFNRESAEDLQALRQMAERATRNAGLHAYWTDLDCMPAEDLEEDVYRISDVVRGAHSLAIAVAPCFDNGQQVTSTVGLLRIWGTRMWTWPEVLLAPVGSRILVYTRGQDMYNPLELDKRNFAATVWEDAPDGRQLVDHYEGTLILSRLELVILAFKCLRSRLGGTTEYCKGDLSYALMGLLRQRPDVDRKDSAFQAFARLSLANDSDRLLERLICVLPKNRDEDWSAMDDVWDVWPWDIYPTCQIAGIGDRDTVVIDGAFGATIKWDSFAKVASINRETWTRLIARLFLRGTPGWFTLAILFFSVRLKLAGAPFLVLALIAILTSPAAVLHCYSGKLWDTQPWLFGFEGYLDIDTIERKIFGFPYGRLRWSPFGSPLSRHGENAYGECEGRDPVMTDASVRKLVEAAPSSAYGDAKIFTLVDTNTMTVTMFEAVRPPVVALLCGSEGGMQRAVMCSYDWTSQTLYRETVLRVETGVLQKMSRVGRVKFGLKRGVEETGRMNE